jgi:UDP-N-acetylmuramoyl-L-alanyl-D-glutamate--2,6-diaminopimelate ligase
MVTRILEEAGKKVAMASTINFRINGNEEKNLSHFTTESAFAVQKFIRKAVDSGCEYLVLETSSHSLDQHRVWGVEYQTAVITNVTREHLDYHRTMEKYRAAKRKLFEVVRKNKGTIIVNMDMENPEEYLNFDVNKKFAYSAGQNDISDKTIQKVVAENIQLEISGSSFAVQHIDFSLKIPGLFNVENALAAICVSFDEGIDFEIASQALKKIQGVPGRMESVPNQKGIGIIVDFALTPNALKRLYETLVKVKAPVAKIIGVFGACGERDRGKRPITGKIVSQYADFVIITNDEPYHEDPMQIIEEIYSGLEGKKENETCWKIQDRRQAIRKALEIAQKDDVVVVTGMGNFETMVVGDKKISWNDRTVIEEELKKLGF